jgi:hypothetical protein
MAEVHGGGGDFLHRESTTIITRSNKNLDAAKTSDYGWSWRRSIVALTKMPRSSIGLLTLIGDSTYLVAHLHEPHLELVWRELWRDKDFMGIRAL